MSSDAQMKATFTQPEGMRNGSLSWTKLIKSGRDCLRYQTAFLSLGLSM